jgi:hypothetical protein
LIARLSGSWLVAMSWLKALARLVRVGARRRIRLLLRHRVGGLAEARVGSGGWHNRSRLRRLVSSQRLRRLSPAGHAGSRGRLSGCHRLRGCLLSCQLDTVPSKLRGGIGRGEQVQVLLSDSQLALASKNVCVLGVLIVKCGQLPARVKALFGVLELGHMAEDGDLFDKVL